MKENTESKTGKDKFVYTPEVIRKIQLIELEMLKELDRICRRHQISYIIEAGTLLGAVRHGGFIPWDDDLDVRMLRKEYDRFCEVCQEELNSDYFLQTYRTDPGYRWGYARILKNGTVYKRKGQHKMTARNGVFIDIFPDDNLPEGCFSNKICTCISWLCRKLLYSEVGALNRKKFISWLGFSFLNLFPKEWGHKGMEYLAKRYQGTDTARVRCFAWGSEAEALGILKKWHTETENIRFEGLTVPAPKDRNGFLMHFFGEDYMTPPPEDKRVLGHPADYIDFGDEG